MLQNYYSSMNEIVNEIILNINKILLLYFKIIILYVKMNDNGGMKIILDSIFVFFFILIYLHFTTL